MALPHPHATDEHPALRRPAGINQRVRHSKWGFALEFDVETLDPKLRALDKATGAIVAEMALPANVHGAPMPSMAGGQ
jgi:hypothetical protein